MCHQRTDFDKVSQTQCLVQFHVQAIGLTRNEYIAPEFLLQVFQHLDSFFQAFRVACHTDVFPHDMSQLTVDRIDCFFTLHVHQLRDTGVNSLFCFHKFRQVSAKARNLDLVRQIVLDRVRQYEVTIGQSLHQSRSTQTVSAVVREVGFTNCEQPRNRSHQFIVYPQTTH